MKLYHVETGLPKVKLPGVVPLSYTQHARQAVLTDRYGLAKKLPKVVNIDAGTVFEIGLDTSGAVEQYAVRFSADDNLFVGPRSGLDLVLVLNRCGGVVTLWFNESHDTHHTLNKSKYEHLP